MLNIQKLNYTLKDKKKFYFIFIFLLITYFSIPKLLNFSSKSIKENLKNGSNVHISSISKIEYKIFPTPRLSILNSNFTIGEDIADTNNSKLEIIFNITKILNFKKIEYKKLIISGGTSIIDLEKVNQLLISADKNNKKLVFRKSNLIFLKKNNFSFEINDAMMNVVKLGGKKELDINGNFLNNKIFIKFTNSLNNQNNLSVKIPELDIETRVTFKKNSLSNFKGTFNIEVFNNFFKFDFIKENSIKLINAFIRSKLVNTALDGEIDIKPNFFLKLNFKISNFNIEKLLPLIQKIYFSNNFNKLSFIKKANGIFTFKSKFEGKITNKNGEILFENFEIGKDKSYFLNAKITEFGKKGKVHFNLIKTDKYQKKLSKKIQVIGYLIPSTSKVIFEKIILEGEKLSIRQTKEYENRFENELVKDSLVNIFNESKIEKYFKNLL